MLLAARLLPRRQHDIEVIGAALASWAGGRGYRRVGVDIGVPVSTVRNRERAFAGHVDAVAALGAAHHVAWEHSAGPLVLSGSVAGDAIEALGCAARAARLRLADAAAAYLTNKAPYLDYPTALAAGWPIATGVIEGACRHLVANRMDITGARWSAPGAEAVLKLRAVKTNGDSDDYMRYHLNQERRRDHETRYSLLSHSRLNPLRPAEPHPNILQHWICGQ